MPYALVASFNPVSSVSNSLNTSNPASLLSKCLPPNIIPELNKARHSASSLPLSVAKSMLWAKASVALSKSFKNW